MGSTNIKTCLNDAVLMAKEAGRILLDFQENGHKLQVIDKKEMGIATNADLAAEKYILNEIAKKYPEHHVLSEEYSFNTEINTTWPLKDYLWIIDPLDGTNNYFNGLPFYSVSIALASSRGIEVGVVYNPELDKIYAASFDEPAYTEFKNKKTVLDQRNNNKQFSDCLLSPFLGASRGLLTTSDYVSLIKIKDKCRAFRRLGSAALEIAMVASGELDGYWEIGLSPWDTAAAAFICAKAGVKVTDLNDQPFSPFNESILSAPPKHHEQITQLLQGQS